MTKFNYKGSAKRDFETFFIPVTESGCWIWVGQTSSRGYGRYRPSGDFKRQRFQAHRYSYEYYVGKIPEGMIVCHKCDEPLCVNPKHMFIGTSKDNAQDMSKKGRARNQYKGRTHCSRGHEYTHDSIYPGKTYRICKACTKINNERFKKV